MCRFNCRRGLSPVRFLFCVFLLVLFSQVLQAHIFNAPLQFFLEVENPWTFRNVRASDLNGDGYIDCVVYSGLHEALYILLGQGNGSFQLAETLESGSNIRHHSLGDLNCDGIPDLVLIRGAEDYYDPDDHVDVYLGIGDGQFEIVGDGWDLQGEEIRESLLHDIDDDGYPDLVITNGNLESVFICKGGGDGTFGELAGYPLGGFGGIPAVGDLDGDGNVDLAIVNNHQATLAILFGQGGGVFADPVHLPCGGTPRCAIIEDLSGDQNLDIAVSNIYDHTVSIFIGKGNGDFFDRVAYPVDSYPGWIQAGDLDGDGNLDIVFAHNYENYAVLSGLGNGVFDESVPLPSAPGGYFFWSDRFLLPDLNGDGVLDLAGAHLYCFVSLLGDGTGSFQTTGRITVGTTGFIRIHETLLTDLNRDSHADLVTLNEGAGHRLRVLPHLANGTFGEPIRIHLPNGARRLAIEDLDGDQNPDLIIGYPLVSNLSVKMGNGDFTFGDAMTFSTFGAVDVLASGDWNEDGFLDLAFGNPAASIVILLGNGDGTFVQGELYSLLRPSDRISAGDINNDGHLDMLVLHGISEGHGSSTILLGDGSGEFEPRNFWHLPWDVQDAKLVYLNGDNLADIVAVIGEEESPGTLDIYLGVGGVMFSLAAQYPLGVDAGRLEVADFDMDNHLDAVIVQQESCSVAVVTAIDPELPSEVHHFSVPLSPNRLVVGDLDLDGDNDVAAWEVEDNRFDILENTTLTRSPVLYTGPGPGTGNPPMVRVFTSSGGFLAEWMAYGTVGFGANVAAGQLFGDPVDEIVTGPGPGQQFGPHVRVFDWGGAPFAGTDFMAYGTQRFGVNVSTGDLDGDDYDEVLTGPGPGAVFGPHVRGWDYNGGEVVTPFVGVNFFAYGTPKWGVHVAAGDIDGDGYDEIITGPGPGAVYGPHVRGWNVDGASAEPMAGISYFAYGSRHHGVRVSAGDLDGDGLDEIVTAPGPSPSFGAHIRGWNYDGSTILPMPGVNFFAAPPEFEVYGATVFAGTDFDGNGRDELLVGAGPDPGLPAHIRLFSFDGTTISLLESFLAFPDSWTYGANVTAGRF